MARVTIGISGWRYPEWRGTFYPKGLVHREELAYAAQRFRSVEINGSFYSLQRPASYERWRAETPADFVFAVKGSRFITHMKKLRDIEVPLANFFASGVLALREKLGPILWQFPETVPFDDRFAEFFGLLPRDTRAAAELAARHDARLDDRCFFEVDQRQRIRHAVELRNPNAASPDLVALLRKHRIALVVADTAQRFPRFEDVTAEFVYVRLHGDTELYASGYGPRALRRWAERIRAWHAGSEPADVERLAPPPPRRPAGRDVYVYFDNDSKARAPFDALALARLLELPQPVLRGRRTTRPSAKPAARVKTKATRALRAARPSR
jgi:uncharacterized protein YecE (DUF72 family)